MTNIRQAPGTQLYWSGTPDPGVVSRELVPRGIKTIISLDVNEAGNIIQESNVIRANGIKYIQNHIIPGSPSNGAQNLVNIFKSQVTTPVYIHCKQGQDRCGFAIALWGMLREIYAPNVESQYQDWPRPCQLVKHVEKLTGYGRGISPSAKQQMNEFIGCGQMPEEQTVSDEVADTIESIQSNAMIADAMIKIAKSGSKNLEKKLNVSSDVVEDLHDSLMQTIDGFDSLKETFKELKISKDLLGKIGYYAEALALLCDILSNEDDYDDEDKFKTILDVNDLKSAVDEVRDSYDTAGGLSQGARGDSGPAGDNLRFFNYIDPDAEIYPGGTVGTNVRARKKFWKALIRVAEKILCSKCLRNPCGCDPCDCGPECPLCNKTHQQEDVNNAFLGGGPQGSPTAEGLPSGVGGLPDVGLHDNYTGISSHMNQPSGAPGAPNGASPVMPAQPNLSS